MTIAEVARFLFVSRSHVRHLLQSGHLHGAPGHDGEYIVDEGSVMRYRRELDERVRRYLDTQTEDDEPPGL
ncbi:helix-turn-helix domain-containing protein [Paraburkholderia sp. RL17-380-BIE-A]|uniref:helix-turn-helix domain-containing protein n=1 Tax=Paraburkholderia sp. RL17-380-BIE-A TaxID=3031630 RepID=UPI0038BD1E1A